MMDSELIALVAGAVLSLALSYIPGLNAKWSALAGDVKRGLMGLLLVAVTAGIYVGGCQGWVPELTCPTVWDALKQLVLALMANQAVYSVSPRVAKG